MPSFGGYLSGHKLWKTVAYGAAALMGRDLGRPAEIRAEGERVQRQLGYKAALMKAGIIPCPFAATPKVKLRVVEPKQTVTAPVAIEPEPYFEPEPPRPPDPEKPRQVLPHRSVCVSAWQGRSPAVSRTGGLRGSSATRRRR